MQTNNHYAKPSTIQCYVIEVDFSPFLSELYFCFFFFFFLFCLAFSKEIYQLFQLNGISPWQSNEIMSISIHKSRTEHVNSDCVANCSKYVQESLYKTLYIIYRDSVVSFRYIYICIERERVRESTREIAADVFH